MPAKAKALVLAEFPVRATPHSPWVDGFSTGIMIPLCSHYGAIYDYARAVLTPLSASRPSQTISVGHFWPLMDVDHLMGLSFGEAAFAVERATVCAPAVYVDQGEI